MSKLNHDGFCQKTNVTKTNKIIRFSSLMTATADLVYLYRLYIHILNMLLACMYIGTVYILYNIACKYTVGTLYLIYTVYTL